MISKVIFLKLSKHFDKIGYKKFAEEIEEGKQKSLRDNEILYQFAIKYALEQDKKKALQFSAYCITIADKTNRNQKEIVHLRIQSELYLKELDVKNCKLILKTVEDKKENVSKKIVSQLRINLAIACRIVGDYSYAYKLYYENLFFWGNDESKEAISGLVRTYYNLLVLYNFVKHQEKTLFYKKKLECFLPKIKDDAEYYSICVLAIIRIEFELNIISADKAIKATKKINTSLTPKTTFYYKAYLIHYLEANNELEKTVEISQEIINNRYLVASNLLIDSIRIYLNYLYQHSTEEKFLAAFEQYFNVLNSEKTLKNRTLELLDKKIKIHKANKEFEASNKTYEIYIRWQKIILEKNTKLNFDITEAKLQIDEKEKELNHIKEIANKKDKINQLLREKNKSLENFASMTAHDIKSPINSISMFLGILENSLDLKVEQKIMFDFISSSSKRLSALIDDLLSFANSETFSNTANVDIELTTILYTVKDNLKAIIKDKNVIIEIPSNLPKIKINASAIIILFQNIITNAIKFSSKDTIPIIKISYEIIDNFIHLHIKDNGIGIAENELIKIFSPFGRSLKTKEIEGSGLGLATCLKIAKSYDGDIKVESKINEGSRFTICLPKSLLVAKKDYTTS